MEREERSGGRGGKRGEREVVKGDVEIPKLMRREAGGGGSKGCYN